MKAFTNRETQRTRCLTYVREAISRVATKSQLHKVQIETLLKQKVSFVNNMFDVNI